jgi:predicted ferric reductase
MSSIIGTNADWYLMRGSGFVALILLTLTVCLGISNVARLSKGGWTRAVAALVHRNVSLLAVVFLGIHILTAISDKYVKIPALAVVVPGLSGYDAFWVGLGALAFDLLIAVTVTSLLRARLRTGTWRLVHWLTYLSWPVALVHAIGSGSGTGADTGQSWSTLIYIGLGLTFAAAVTTRLALGRRATVAGRPADLLPVRRYATTGHVSRRSA